MEDRILREYAVRFYKEANEILYKEDISKEEIIKNLKLLLINFKNFVSKEDHLHALNWY